MRESTKTENPLKDLTRSLIVRFSGLENVALISLATSADHGDLQINDHFPVFMKRLIIILIHGSVKDQ